MREQEAGNQGGFAVFAGEREVRFFGAGRVVVDVTDEIALKRFKADRRAHQGALRHAAVGFNERDDGLGAGHARRGLAIKVGTAARVPAISRAAEFLPAWWSAFPMVAFAWICSCQHVANMRRCVLSKIAHAGFA